MTDRRERNRQFVHISLGLFIIAIILVLPYYRYLLSIGLLGAFACSLLSMQGIWLPVVSWLFDIFERSDERNGLRAKGFLFFVMGSALSVFLFTQTIALASIAILTFGDSISHFFWPRGRLRHPLNNNRFLEGMFSGSIAGALAAWVFIPFGFAFPAALISMFFEALEIRFRRYKLDDNLFIPLVAGAIITLLQNLI
ncbi:MAG: hypothetical protein ACLFTH_00930 [Candidatus Woesearchaeota archaeon]